MTIPVALLTAASRVTSQFGPGTLNKVWELVFTRYYAAPLPTSASRLHPAQRIEAILAQRVQANSSLVEKIQDIHEEVRKKYKLDQVATATLRPNGKRKNPKQPKSCPVCKRTPNKPAILLGHIPGCVEKAVIRDLDEAYYQLAIIHGCPFFGCGKMRFGTKNAWHEHINKHRHLDHCGLQTKEGKECTWRAALDPNDNMQSVDFCLLELHRERVHAAPARASVSCSLDEGEGIWLVGAEEVQKHWAAKCPLSGEGLRDTEAPFTKDNCPICLVDEHLDVRKRMEPDSNVHEHLFTAHLFKDSYAPSDAAIRCPCCREVVLVSTAIRHLQQLGWPLLKDGDSADACSSSSASKSTAAKISPCDSRASASGTNDDQTDCASASTSKAGKTNEGRVSVEASTSASATISEIKIDALERVRLSGAKHMKDASQAWLDGMKAAESNSSAPLMPYEGYSSMVVGPRAAIGKGKHKKRVASGDATNQGGSKTKAGANATNQGSSKKKAAADATNQGGSKKKAAATNQDGSKKKAAASNQGGSKKKAAASNQGGSKKKAAQVRANSRNQQDEEQSEEEEEMEEDTESEEEVALVGQKRKSSRVPATSAEPAAKKRLVDDDETSASEIESCDDGDDEEYVPEKRKASRQRFK